MKNSIICFVIISFLFQSCYTYKAIDLKETQLIVGKNYQIRQNTKFTKAELKAANDSTITFVIKNHEVNVPTAKIKEIKVQKFSTLKTIGFILSVGVVAVVIIGAIEMSDFELGGFTFPTN
jgi:hypothetical protein